MRRTGCVLILVMNNEDPLSGWDCVHVNPLWMCSSCSLLFLCFQGMLLFTTCFPRPEKSMNWRNCGLSAAMMSSWKVFLLRRYQKISFMMLKLQSDEPKQIGFFPTNFFITLDETFSMPASRIKCFIMWQLWWNNFCPIIFFTSMHISKYDLVIRWECCGIILLEQTVMVYEGLRIG